MGIEIEIALAALASAASIGLAAHLVGPLRRPEVQRERQLGSFDSHVWRDEVQPLREMVLQLRLELAEVRRASAVREAELRRLLIQSVEERIEHYPTGVTLAGSSEDVAARAA